MLPVGISVSQLPGTEGGSWSENAKGENYFQAGEKQQLEPSSEAVLP